MGCLPWAVRTCRGGCCWIPRGVHRSSLDRPDVVAHLLLDVDDDLLALLVAAVDEQPPGALGDVPAHEQDADAQDGAETEGEAPAQLGVEDVGVQQGEGGFIENAVATVPTR